MLRGGPQSLSVETKIYLKGENLTEYAIKGYTVHGHFSSGLILKVERLLLL